MLIKGEEFVSIHEFVEVTCQFDNDITLERILKEFCTLFGSKYVYQPDRYFIAEAPDKTRHVLFPLNLVLDIFLNDSVKRAFTKKPSTSDQIKVVESKFKIICDDCCCVSKKLKKAIVRVTAFNDFVRQGDVELRRFNSLKPELKFLIALDIEAYEWSLNKLLEFGVSVYDLERRTTSNTHIIISEHYHLKNGRLVDDNKANYNFGPSMLLNLNTALEHISDILSTPNSCLIGHDIKADINFLRSASVKDIDMPIFDTQLIYKQATFGENLLGLGRVLDEIGIRHSNLHNAGNDAYYTLEVFKVLARL